METTARDKLHTVVATVLAATAFHLAAASAPPDALETIGLSPAQEDVVTHVVELFEDAGLPLPPVVVRLGDGLPGCDGHLGFHRAHEDHSEIFLCYPQISGIEQRILAHELGHAWASIGLSDQRRDDFQALRGWEHWRNYELAEWDENGTEQAAEIIKWGVSDIPVPVFVEQASCDELREGYRTITGAEPPHGRTEYCDPQPAPADPSHLGEALTVGP